MESLLLSVSAKFTSSIRLKNPAELELLRKTYGEVFWLIGVFAPNDVRRKRLVNQMGFKESELDGLIRNDYSEKEDYGQSVRETFFHATCS